MAFRAHLTCPCVLQRSLLPFCPRLDTLGAEGKDGLSWSLVQGLARGRR